MPAIETPLSEDDYGFEQTGRAIEKEIYIISFTKHLGILLSDKFDYIN